MGCGFLCVDALPTVVADFYLKYLGVSRFVLHVLLYRMVAVVLCSRLLMFLYSCMIFACLALVNLMRIRPCIILIFE